MSAVTPAVVVGLCVLQFAFTTALDGQPGPEQAWRAFAGASLALWAFLMLPLFVTLEAALLAGIEHGDRQWKHLLALPVPRAAHYLAFALAASLVGAAAAVALSAWEFSRRELE